MLSYEEIINYCSNYRVENGNVFDKRTNELVTDENIILKVKSSVIVYKRAQTIHKDDLFLNGKETKSKEKCISTAMQQLSVNNEVSSIATNKLINKLLTCNGHYESFMSGNNLNESQYFMFSNNNIDYGIAFLRLKFREKGLDVEDLKINLQQDYGANGHGTGQYKVIIDFKIKKYEKVTHNTQNNISQSNIQHPRANELNQLERQKQIAKQNNDEVMYNYAKSSIEKIIRESRLDVSPEQWDSMSTQDKISFVKIKMNEAKILNDQDEFNYWNSNLNSLSEKLVAQSEVREYHQPSYNSAPIDNRNTIDYQEMLQGLEVKKDYNYYFNEMLKATQKYNPNTPLSEEEKKQMIGEIFYYEGYLIESLNNDEELRQVMTRSVYELSSNEMQVKLQKIILTEIEEKYKQLHPEVQQVEQQNESKNKPSSINDTQLGNSIISDIRKKYQNIENSYYEMMQDNELDEVEASILISSLEKLITEAIKSKKQITDSSIRSKVNIVIDDIEDIKKKITIHKNNLSEYEKTGRSL